MQLCKVSLHCNAHCVHTATLMCSYFCIFHSKPAQNHFIVYFFVFKSFLEISMGVFASKLLDFPLKKKEGNFFSEKSPGCNIFYNEKWLLLVRLRAFTRSVAFTLKNVWINMSLCTQAVIDFYFLRNLM